MKRKKNKNYWLLIFGVGTVLCYLCYFLTKDFRWFVFGLLILITGGFTSMNVKKDKQLKEGGYNQRNLDKAKKYERKKR